MSWECEAERRGRSSKFRVECTDGDKTTTMRAKMTERKIFPEEDYEYDGEVNGKKIEGRRSYGYAPMTTIVGENEDLSDLERTAGKAVIDSFE